MFASLADFSLSDAMEFAERLRTGRENRGLSQTALAAQTSFSQSRISEWENGKTVPSLKQAMELAHVLEMSLDWLAGLSLDAQPPPRPTEAQRNVWRVIQRIGWEAAYDRLVLVPEGSHPSEPVSGTGRTWNEIKRLRQRKNRKA